MTQVALRFAWRELRGGLRHERVVAVVMVAAAMGGD